MALKRAWPVGISIVFNLIYYKADTLILGVYRSTAEVGIYGAAYRVLELLITVPFMYAGVLLPVLAHAWRKEERERLTGLITHSLEAMIVLVAPLIAGTLALGVPLMQAVAGRDFGPAGDALKVLILAVAVIYLNTVISHAVVAMDQQRKMIPAYIVVALVTLVGYLTLIPIYGLWAAAWLTVASETAIALSNLIITHRALPLKLPWRVPLASAAAATIMGLACYLMRNLWLGLSLLASVIIYAAALYALGGISKDLIRDLLAIKKTPQSEVGI